MLKSGLILRVSMLGSGGTVEFQIFAKGAAKAGDQIWLVL